MSFRFRFVFGSGARLQRHGIPEDQGPGRGGPAGGQRGSDLVQLREELLEGVSGALDGGGGPPQRLRPSSLVPTRDLGRRGHRCPFWLIHGLPGGSINYQGHQISQNGHLLWLGGRRRTVILGVRAPQEKKKRKRRLNDPKAGHWKREARFPQPPSNCMRFMQHFKP